MIAKDNGTPSRRTENLLTVRIRDVNDNSPIIDPATLTGEVVENKPANTGVVQVKATDRDLGENAELRFAMEKNDLFAIDADSGQVKTLRPLDREENDRYAIKITVHDKAKDKPLKTDAILNITVLDVDDNCPTFNSLVYTATVEENARYGSYVVQVSATDRDIGSNAILDYGIYDSNDRGAFNIDQNTGNITVGGDVDLEYTREYLLKIRAGSLVCGLNANDSNIGEGGEEKRHNYTLANVYVKVIDKNDNWPVFRGSNEKLHYNRIDMTHLFTLYATDSDSGPGGKVDMTSFF